MGCYSQYQVDPVFEGMDGGVGSLVKSIGQCGWNSCLVFLADHGCACQCTTFPGLDSFNLISGHATHRNPSIDKML